MIGRDAAVGRDLVKRDRLAQVALDKPKRLLHRVHTANIVKRGGARLIALAVARACRTRVRRRYRPWKRGWRFSMNAVRPSR